MATVPFPRQESVTNLSIMSKQSTTRATAQEVHDLIYGHDTHVQATRGGVESALERIYEPNASSYLSTLAGTRTAHPLPLSPVYENPLLTATSRAIITDIYKATRQWAELDMPKPLGMLATLFRRTDAAGPEPWFRALRVWSEIGDICETESFDGHRKSIIEHTLHVLILPGIHAGRAGHRHFASDSSLDVVTSSSSSTPLYSLPHLQRSSQPALAVPGTRMTVPSPLHLQLRILTRLEFNDQSQVTHHRDFWAPERADVKDLVALLPGAQVAQYVGTRLAARALAAVGNLGVWVLGRKRPDVEPDDIEWASPADNSLGLLGIDAK